jgi:bleomycin hydrolase
LKYISKKSVLGGLFVVLMILSSALADDGSLSNDVIANIRASFHMDSQTRAMYNAITNNDINNLALNRDIVNAKNDIFSHKIKTNGITNQKSSGRCWLFAGLNILRPKVIEKYKLSDFEFSENYLSFWDKMEKANSFLEFIIELRDHDLMDRELDIILERPFGDGGYWKYVVALIDKYGAVPKDIMPETHSSEKTGTMNKLISRKLRTGAVELRAMAADGKTVDEMRSAKKKILDDVYKMLVMNLGEPPTEFEWRYENRDTVISDKKTYTPQTFYKEFVGIDLNDYANLLNDPSKEYGKHYQLKLSRNIYDGSDVDYANVDIDMLKKMAAKSVLDDEPVWFGNDVGKDQSRSLGIMADDLYDYGSIFNTNMSLTKADQLLYRESAPNHAMVLVGVDIKNDKPVKWLVENSWGEKNGDKGYWTMYDSWFDSHVYNVIVKKKYVPKEILEIFKQPVVELPPWDPMYYMFDD